MGRYMSYFVVCSRYRYNSYALRGGGGIDATVSAGITQYSKASNMAASTGSAMTI